MIWKFELCFEVINCMLFLHSDTRVNELLLLLLMCGQLVKPGNVHIRSKTTFAFLNLFVIVNFSLTHTHTHTSLIHLPIPLSKKWTVYKFSSKQSLSIYLVTFTGVYNPWFESMTFFWVVFNSKNAAKVCKQFKTPSFIFL